MEIYIQICKSLFSETLKGPAPDPKCELNITLPHLLHFFICAKDIMVTVLLFQVIGGMGGGGGGSFISGFGWGHRRWVSYGFSNFCSVNCSFMAGT